MWLVPCGDLASQPGGSTQDISGLRTTQTGANCGGDFLACFWLTGGVGVDSMRPCTSRHSNPVIILVGAKWDSKFTLPSKGETVPTGLGTSKVPCIWRVLGLVI